MNHALSKLDAKKELGTDEKSKPFEYSGHISTWYDKLPMKEKILIQMQAGSDEQLKAIYKKHGRNNRGRSVDVIKKEYGQGMGFGQLNKGTRDKIEKMLKRTGYSFTPVKQTVRQDHLQSIKIANRKMKKSKNFLSQKNFGKKYDNLSPKRQKFINKEYEKGGFASRHAKTLGRKLVPAEKFVHTFTLRTKKGKEMNVLVGGKKIDKAVEDFKTKYITKPIRKAIKKQKWATQQKNAVLHGWGGKFRVRTKGRKGQFTTKDTSELTGPFDMKRGKNYGQPIIDITRGKNGRDRNGNPIYKKNRDAALRFAKRLGKLKFVDPKSNWKPVNITPQWFMKLWDNPKYHNFKDLPKLHQNIITMADHLRQEYPRVEGVTLEMLKNQAHHEAELNRFLTGGGMDYIKLHGTTDKAKVGKMVQMAADGELPIVRSLIERMNKQKKSKPKKVKAKPKPKPKTKKKPEIHKKQLPKTKTKKKKTVKKKKKKKRGESDSMRVMSDNVLVLPEKKIVTPIRTTEKMNWKELMKELSISLKDMMAKDTSEAGDLVYGANNKYRFQHKDPEDQYGKAVGVRGNEYLVNDYYFERARVRNGVPTKKCKICGKLIDISTTNFPAGRNLFKHLNTHPQVKSGDSDEDRDMARRYRLIKETITPEEAGFTWNNLVNKRVKKLTLHDVGISDDNLARLKWEQIPEPMRNKIMSIEAFEQLVMRHKKLPSYSAPMQAIASLVNNKFAKKKTAETPLTPDQASDRTKKAWKKRKRSNRTHDELEKDDSLDSPIMQLDIIQRLEKAGQAGLNYTKLTAGNGTSDQGYYNIEKLDKEGKIKFNGKSWVLASVHKDSKEPKVEVDNSKLLENSLAIQKNISPEMKQRIVNHFNRNKEAIENSAYGKTLKALQDKFEDIQVKIAKRKGCDYDPKSKTFTSGGDHVGEMVCGAGATTVWLQAIEGRSLSSITNIVHGDKDVISHRHLKSKDSIDHAWLELDDGTIIDSAYGQMYPSDVKITPDMRLRIVQPSDPEYKKYHGKYRDYPFSSDGSGLQIPFNEGNDFGKKLPSSNNMNVQKSEWYKKAWGMEKKRTKSGEGSAERWNNLDGKSRSEILKEVWQTYKHMNPYPDRQEFWQKYIERDLMTFEWNKIPYELRTLIDREVRDFTRGSAIDLENWKGELFHAVEKLSEEEEEERHKKAWDTRGRGQKKKYSAKLAKPSRVRKWTRDEIDNEEFEIRDDLDRLRDQHLDERHHDLQQFLGVDEKGYMGFDKYLVKLMLLGDDSLGHIDKMETKLYGNKKLLKEFRNAFENMLIEDLEDEIDDDEEDEYGLTARDDFDDLSRKEKLKLVGAKEQQDTRFLFWVASNLDDAGDLEDYGVPEELVEQGMENMNRIMMTKLRHVWWNSKDDEARKIMLKYGDVFQDIQDGLNKLDSMKNGNAFKHKSGTNLFFHKKTNENFRNFVTSNLDKLSGKDPIQEVNIVHDDFVSEAQGHLGNYLDDKMNFYVNRDSFESMAKVVHDAKGIIVHELGHHIYRHLDVDDVDDWEDHVGMAKDKKAARLISDYTSMLTTGMSFDGSKINERTVREEVFTELRTLQFKNPKRYELMKTGGKWIPRESTMSVKDWKARGSNMSEVMQKLNRMPKKDLVKLLVKNEYDRKTILSKKGLVHGFMEDRTSGSGSDSNAQWDALLEASGGGDSLDALRDDIIRHKDKKESVEKIYNGLGSDKKIRILRAWGIAEREIVELAQSDNLDNIDYKGWRQATDKKSMKEFDDVVNDSGYGGFANDDDARQKEIAMQSLIKHYEKICQECEIHESLITESVNKNDDIPHTVYLYDKNDRPTHDFDQAERGSLYSPNGHKMLDLKPKKKKNLQAIGEFLSKKF